MKIISSFTDYYDGVSRSFYSDTPVYVRQEDEMPKEVADYLLKIGADKIPSFHRRVFRPDPFMRGSGYIEYELVVFCGKIYPCIRVKRHMMIAEEICYSYEHVIKIFNEDKKISISKYAFDQIKQFFSVYGGYDCIDLCVSQKCPVFIFYFNESFDSTKNSFLKPQEFFRAMDPYQTYQELEMFVGGILAPESKPMVEISDKDRLAQYGFNEKSFRHPVRFKDLK